MVTETAPTQPEIVLRLTTSEKQVIHHFEPFLQTLEHRLQYLGLGVQFEPIENGVLVFFRTREDLDHFLETAEFVGRRLHSRYDSTAPVAAWTIHLEVIAPDCRARVFSQLRAFFSLWFDANQFEGDAPYWFRVQFSRQIHLPRLLLKLDHGIVNSRFNESRNGVLPAPEPPELEQ